jgi:O-antigen ligase
MSSATDQRAGRPHGSGPPPARRQGSLLPEVLVLALFAAVPVAVWPWFHDQYTTIKWFVLIAAAALWFLAELWGPGGPGWPVFVREHWKACLVLAALLLWSGLRSGPGASVPVLLERASFVLLVLVSYGYFVRNGGRTGAIALGAGVAAGLVVGLGLVQLLGWRPLPFVSGGDQRSATFGNTNMAAQFLGFAVILVLTGSAPVSPLGRRARDGLVAASLVYLYFLSCRSVFLALAVALALLLATGRLSLWSLARMLGAATVGVLLLLHVASARGIVLLHPLSPEVLAEKALSTEWRLGVWKSTLEMIRDHPLGVGSGSFGDAFIPYQLGLEMIPGEHVLFRTPHNESLRLLAEEGVVFSAIAAMLVASLWGRLHATAHSGWWRSEGGALLVAGTAFLGVEAFFQFPFGTAFGCLMAAVLLGLAFAILEPRAPGAGRPTEADGRRWRWRVLGTGLSAVVLVLLGRVVTSEVLFAGERDDPAAQEAACRLNPRNLQACVTAAWLRIRDGERREGRALLVRTLERSPYYHPAIRLLGEEAETAGDPERACLYLWIYDRLFRGRSAMPPRVHALCGDGPPAALPPGVTMPYYGELPLAPSDAALR